MHAQCFSFVENPSCLLRGESSRLDKCITELSETSGLNGRKVVNHPVHECGAIAMKFQGQRVRSEISRYDFERRLASHRLEHPDFMVEVQPVAALGFNGRGPVLHKPI